MTGLLDVDTGDIWYWTPANCRNIVTMVTVTPTYIR